MKEVKKITLLLALGLLFVPSVLSAAYKTGLVPNGAVVSGKVVFKGKVPAPKKLLITKNQDVCGEGYVERQEVKVSRDRSLTDVVVTLEGMKKGKPWAKPANGYLLNQKRCTFIPYLQVIPKGAKLTVVNSDPHLHNIHTYEQIGRARRTVFNVAQPTQGHKVQKTIKPRRGKAIRIECDAHNWMLGWMYVVDNPYYAIVKKDGSFNIKDVPPGNYTLKVWHPFLGTKKQKVKVSANGKVKANFEFSQ
ncbi:MAG: beta-sandwich domain-containing protein [Candidatus Methylomirabilales bacterium]